MRLLPACTLLTPALLAQAAQFMPDPQRLPQPALPPGFDYRVFAFADIDGDGDTDAAVANPRIDIQVLRRAGGAWNPTTIMGSPSSPEPAGGVSAMLWRDFDGDGDLDLIAGTDVPRLPTAVGLFRNDGAAFPWRGTIALPAFANARVVHLAAGDVDGDGDADVLLGCDFATAGSTASPAPFLRLLQNQGQLTFTAAPAALPALATPRVVPALVDVDGDGDLDVLAARSGAGVLLLRNQGGTFTDASAGLPAGSAAAWLLAGDLDGDAAPDALLLRADGRVDALWNQGGSFQLQTAVLAAGGETALRGELADVDGDGDADALLQSARGFDVLRNQGGRTFVREVAARRILPLAALAAAQLDGGGTDAIAAWGRNPGATTTTDHYGVPGRLLGDARLDAGFVTPPTDSEHLEAADLDGDGRLELVADAGIQSDLVLQHNLGHGRFAATTLPGLGGTAARAGDLDRDGDRDLVVVRQGLPGTLRVLRNDGGLAFAQLQQLPFPSGNPRVRLQLGDLDGDGFADAVATADVSVRMLRNAGNGQLADLGQLPTTGSGHPADFALADFDRDGDLDLVLAAGASGCLDTLRNDGAGAFTLLPACVVSTVNHPSRLVAFDADGDGDADLAAIESGALRQWRNDGGFVFTDRTAAIPATVVNQATDLLAADFDEDGDTDLIATGPLLRYLLNDGGGTFTDATAGRWTLSRSQPSRGLAADFDGDGDLDVVTRPGAGDPVVAWNQLRGLATVQEPRLGGTLLLRLAASSGFAPAGTACLPFLAFAQTPVAIPVPGVAGTLSLPPPQAAALPSLLLPGVAGVAFSTTPLPQQPALLGTTLVAQALFASPAFGLGFSPTVEEWLRR